MDPYPVGEFRIKNFFKIFPISPAELFEIPLLGIFLNYTPKFNSCQFLKKIIRFKYYGKTMSNLREKINDRLEAEKTPRKI